MGDDISEMKMRLAALAHSEEVNGFLERHPHVHMGMLCIRADGKPACERLTSTRPIAQHAKQSTAYSFPAGVFWFVAGACAGAAAVALAVSSTWGVW